jgi:DNA polymerase-3 subunit alpha
MLASEFATVGFYISGHPLSKYAAKLSELGAIDLAAVEGAGTARKSPWPESWSPCAACVRAKGNAGESSRLQDMTGVLEVLAFPESFARLEAVFKSNAPLLLKGRVNVEEAGTRLAVMEARRLEDIGQRPPSVMRVRVDLAAVDPSVLDELKELFVASPAPARWRSIWFLPKERWPRCAPISACARIKNWCAKFAAYAVKTQCNSKRARGK